MTTFPQYSRHNPRPVRRCFLCGTNTMLPRNADESMLAILKNGRSPILCRKHWRLLRRFACPSVIEHYRRKFMQDAANLTRVIDSLAFSEKKHQLEKPHGKL